jgi:hypothetical protein
VTGSAAGWDAGMPRDHGRVIKLWDADREVIDKWLRYLKKYSIGGVGMKDFFLELCRQFAYGFQDLVRDGLGRGCVGSGTCACAGAVE